MIVSGVAFWSAGSAALVAPTGVTGTRDGIDIDLVWVHDGAGATGFRIYRRSRSPGGSFGSYGSVWRTITPETDVDTTDATSEGGLEYQYRVHAWDGVTEGPGGESNVIDDVAPIAWSIGFPVDYASDDTSVSWGFGSVVDSSGHEVWYRIGASMGADPTATGIEAYEGILTPRQINLGASGLTAYIIARARYGSGPYRYGAWSEERSVTSLKRVPGAPTSVSFALTTATSGTLTWSNGSPATQDNFELQVASRAAGSGGAFSAWSDTLPSTDTASPYVFDEVLEGNEYKLRIRATNTAGSSSWVESNVVAFANPPAAASGVSAVKDGTYGYAYVDVTWTDNSDNEDGFKIQRAPDSGGGAGTYAQVGTVGGGVTSFEDQSAGPPIGSSGPTITAVDSVDDDELSISISGLPANATDWKVYYVASLLDFQIDDTGVSVKSVSGTGSTTALTGLAADTTYGIRVVAENAAGRGFPSARSTYATGPTAPKTLAAVVNGGNHDLSWDIGNRDEDTVLIERKIGAGSWSQVASKSAGSTTHSITAVASSSYRVRFLGEITYSNTATP